MDENPYKSPETSGAGVPLPPPIAEVRNWPFLKLLAAGLGLAMVENSVIVAVYFWLDQ